MEAPCTAENVRAVGLTVIVVGAAVTVKLTGITTGFAPVAVAVIVALWVPAVSEPVATVAVTEPLPVPEAGLSVSHAALSLADQERVPPPVLLMAML